MQTTHNGDWRDYRHDSQLTGNSPLRGGKNAVREKSVLTLGGGFQEVKLVPDDSGDLLLASGGGVQRVTRDWEYVWQSKTFGAHWITGVFDLDADGELEIVTSNGRDILILSARTGEILWRENVALPRSFGTAATMLQVRRLLPESRGMQIVVPCFSAKEILVFDSSQGTRETTLLHTLWMDDSYHPSVCIGDVNRDGIEEIVIARLGGVYVFSPVSGEMLTQTLWASDTERRRNYGQFVLSDIDRDGDLEAIVLSDKVSRHIAVLDNDGGGVFTPLWDRFIQHIYPADTTELRYASNSISDATESGIPQITVSIFNHKGDEKWHTEVIDSATGKTLHDRENAYLRGIQDVDSDGTSELLLSEELERIPGRLSTLTVQRASGEKLWEITNARFAERTIANAPTSVQFKPEVFANHEVWFERFGGREQFFVFGQSEDGATRLSAIDPSNSFAQRDINLSNQHECRIALLSNDELILSSADGELTKLSAKDAKSKSLQTGFHLTTDAHFAARPGSIPTVVNHNGKSFVIAPNFSDEICCWICDGERPAPLWRVKGRSRVGFDGVFHAVSVIELEGEPLVIVVDDAGLAHAQISLYRLDGFRYRSYPLTGLPPHIPGTRLGAYDWLEFTHSAGPAIFVSFYRSPSMNSEYSLALDLSNAKVLWEFPHSGAGEYGRGVGAWGAASMHLVNGKPEAVLCAKDTILRIDLESGTLSHAPKLLTDFTSQEMQRQGILKEQGLKTWSSIDDPFTAYGSVILKDVDNDGIDELLCVSSFGGFGVIGDDMIARWWKVASFSDTIYRMPTLCDIDGDGKLELVQGHSNGEVCAYDAQTGEMKHSIDLAGITTDIISCDIDGDGREECIAGVNDGRLLVLGVVNGSLGIKREWNIGSAVGSPVVAEIYGKLSVLVVTGSGQLRIFA